MARFTHRRRSPPGKVNIRIEGEKGSYKAELVNAPKEVVKEEETVSIKKPKLLQKVSSKDKTKEDKKVEEKVKVKEEETKEAIEKVPKKKLEDEASGTPEKKHAHRSKEKVIPTEKAGQLRKD